MEDSVLQAPPEVEQTLICSTVEHNQYPSDSWIEPTHFTPFAWVYRCSTDSPLSSGTYVPSLIPRCSMGPKHILTSYDSSPYRGHMTGWLSHRSEPGLCSPDCRAPQQTHAGRCPLAAFTKHSGRLLPRLEVTRSPRFAVFHTSCCPSCDSVPMSMVSFSHTIFCSTPHKKLLDFFAPLKVTVLYPQYESSTT